MGGRVGWGRGGEGGGEGRKEKEGYPNSRKTALNLLIVFKYRTPAINKRETVVVDHHHLDPTRPQLVVRHQTTQGLDKGSDGGGEGR